MTKVVIANGWVSPDGRTYKAGQTAEVDPGVARDLLSRHKARPAPEPDKKAKASEPVTAAEKTEASKPVTAAKKTEASKPVAAAKEAKNV